MSPTGKLRHRITTTALAAAVAVAAVAVVVYYYGHDPSVSPSPRCFVRVVTGYDCPGCGAQRAFHAILHGRFSEAWAYNPFVFFAIPVGAAYVVVEAWRRRFPRLYAAMTRPEAVAAILAAIVAWWIGRNL